MDKSYKLITGFSISDAKRIKGLLIKLLPYIDTNKIAIVGGLAIRFHLTKAGIVYPVRQFNDLDLMAENVKAISPKIAKDFLIYHFHYFKKNSFFVALVDPALKIKVDIFDWHPPLEEYIKIKFGNYQLKMRIVKDQCPDCRSTKKFRITPMGQIYKILGYVE